MNDSLYEDYMRSVLGYQPTNNYRDTYETNYDNYDMYSSSVPTMANMQSTMNLSSGMTAMSNLQIQELENCYPEIYRIVYPMVQTACSKNTRPLTKQLIDGMTEEIYFALEDRDLEENRTTEKVESKTIGKNVMEKNMPKSNTEENRSTESRQRVIRNTGLRDLIRILLLRELLGRPSFPGFRPPRPRPPRPPMRPPFRPPMGPGPVRPPRPPQPRGEYFSSLDDSYDLYEY